MKVRRRLGIAASARRIVFANFNVIVSGQFIPGNNDEGQRA
jgi:hypothetical protein